jgi:hypothetical protein
VRRRFNIQMITGAISDPYAALALFVWLMVAIIAACG